MVRTPLYWLLMKIYLAILATSVAAERAFSVLERIKLWLRNSMGQERLFALSILNIEKELAKIIDTDNVIDKFAAIKDRRIHFFRIVNKINLLFVFHDFYKNKRFKLNRVLS